MVGAAEVVEVTDPAHPLYGLTFPLIEVANKPQLGRACAVRLTPGVVRLIPLAATDRGGVPPVRTACRLSVPALRALVALAAALGGDRQEERDDGPAGAPARDGARAATPVALGATGRAAAGVAAPPDLEGAPAGGAGAGAGDLRPGRAGGAACR
jgi:hypothetical protein